MAELFANSGDPDQMPCSAASDQGLHCLPITLLRVSRLQWVNSLPYFFSNFDEVIFIKKKHFDEILTIFVSKFENVSSLIRVF